MKRPLTLMLVLLLLLTACSGAPAGPAEPPAEEAAEPVEIKLWTYPVGEWGNPTAISSLVSGFQRANPDIRLTVEHLDYDTGDARVEEAIASGTLPDLVLESPERLLSDWGERGLMADLTGLWETEEAGEIYDSVRAACRLGDGTYCVYPICMSAHCMAINYDLFQAAGALRYLDEETRTWTTEGFIQAVEALRAYGQEQVAAVYCGGQGGDQGTRALVTNLCGGSFTDPDHTRYTVASPENIRALELLRDLEGVEFDPDLAGAGEVERFCKGELAMAFCWNGALEVLHTVKNPDLDFRILAMTFPAETGEPRLESGIWGFGVFESCDARRTEAAKAFIRYVTGDDARYTRAVQIANFWPVRDVPGIYDNDPLMSAYSAFIPYAGDYCQVTPNWVAARGAWWKMLQQVGAGEDVPTAVAAFSREVSGG